jgi:hypothetical protein
MNTRVQIWLLIFMVHYGRSISTRIVDLID